MAWIPMISKDKANDRLRELYEKYSGPEGDLDHIIKIHSLNPASLQGHVDFYKTLMRGRSPLSRIQREMLAVVVSAANRCHY